MVKIIQNFDKNVSLCFSAIQKNDRHKNLNGDKNDRSANCGS